MSGAHSVTRNAENVVTSATFLIGNMNFADEEIPVLGTTPNEWEAYVLYADVIGMMKVSFSPGQVIW